MAIRSLLISFNMAKVYANLASYIKWPNLFHFGVVLALRSLTVTEITILTEI